MSRRTCGPVTSTLTLRGSRAAGTQTRNLPRVQYGGNRASGGYYGGNIKLWPKEAAGEPVVFSHGSEVKPLAVLPDGRLAAGGLDGAIKLWLVDERKLIAAFCLRAGRKLSRDLPSNWRSPHP